MLSCIGPETNCLPWTSVQLVNHVSAKISITRHPGYITFVHLSETPGPQGLAHQQLPKFFESSNGLLFL